MKISMLLIAATASALAASAPRAHAAPVQPKAQWKSKVRSAPTCDKVSDWFKSANDYLKNGQVSPGKVPALYATVTMVSIEPLQTLGGKKPDRLGMMYAWGEVTSGGFPVYVTFEGKLPLWINNGDDKNPFGGGGNSTLNMVISEAGSQTFNWQVDGRNRLGKGPQSFALNAQTAQMTPDFLLYQGALNFHGFKNITLALVRGEKDAPATPKKVVGARYRISPSFLVTNSNDGIADNTVEVKGSIGIYQNKVWKLWLDGPKGSANAGQRLAIAPFEMESRFDQPETGRFTIKGSLWDHDDLGNDDMWKLDHTVDMAYYAKTPNKIAKFPPAIAFQDDDAQGTLEMKIEKIGDVY